MLGKIPIKVGVGVVIVILLSAGTYMVTMTVLQTLRHGTDAPVLPPVSPEAISTVENILVQPTEPSTAVTPDATPPSAASGNNVTMTNIGGVIIETGDADASADVK